ncbi:MAG: SsrA-binding protein SmpB [Luteibaculaceae bacterium]
MATQVNIKNKKASFEFHFIETFDAGMQLTGTEIKSIREGKASIAEAYCYVEKSEIFIKGMHITTYDKGGYNNHDPYRIRKLLLNRKEINKIEKKVKERGITLIPLKVFFSASGYAKISIALAKGKKIFDKREDLKSKDVKKALDRVMKGAY